MKLVIESPLSAPNVEGFLRNYRYLLWCCRALWLYGRHHAIASHMLNPWYMDDANAEERAAGIDNAWVWDPTVTHVFFEDLGVSGGMRAARQRCMRELVPYTSVLLANYSPECWAAFQRGEWPPHTLGFQLQNPGKCVECGCDWTTEIRCEACQ